MSVVPTAFDIDVEPIDPNEEGAVIGMKESVACHPGPEINNLIAAGTQRANRVDRTLQAAEAIGKRTVFLGEANLGFGCDDTRLQVGNFVTGIRAHFTKLSFEAVNAFLGFLVAAGKHQA